VSSVPTPKLLRDARPRLLISIVISALVFILLEVDALDSPRHYHLGLRRYLFLSLGLVDDEPCYYQKMRRSARAQDEGRLAVLTLLLATDCTSLLAIGFMLKDNKGLPATDATRNAFRCDSYLFLVAHAHDVRSALRTTIGLQETTSERHWGLDFPRKSARLLGFFYIFFCYWHDMPG